MIAPLFNPQIGANTLPLRDYQQAAVDAVRAEFAAGKRATLLILATGLGKTVVFSNIARRVAEKGGRVLVLAHRDELITQAANTIDRVGLECGIEKSKSYSRAFGDPPVTIATVQTMQRERLKTWPTDYFRLIVVDESHHVTAASYQKIFKHFDAAYHLGVTATPDRADEDSLATVYESVAFEMNIWDAMTAPPPGPYLSRLSFVQCDVDIDLRELRTQRGDFTVAELEERIGPMVEILANAIKQEIGNRQTLIFCPDINSSQGMATALQSIGVNADWVSGKSLDRAQKMAQYKNKDTQVLVNCMLFTEGFDAPETSAIVLCRPTNSRSLMAQMVGRGTRIAKGKTDCLIVDFNYLTDRHELVHPVDLFADKSVDHEAIREARRRAKQSKREDDLVDLINDTREKVRAEKEQVQIEVRERKINYVSRVKFDPRSISEAIGIEYDFGEVKDAYHVPATPKQRKAIARFGIKNADQFSKSLANAFLSRAFDRSKQGLASPKQVGALINYGYAPEEAQAMKRSEATKVLSKLWS